MMASHLVALAAALSMGVPSAGNATSGSVLWVGLCSGDRSGARIPIPLQPEQDRSPAKACHATCSVAITRKLR